MNQQNEKTLNNNIRKMAETVLQDPELLNSEYCWLMTGETRRGHIFGYELGQLDLENKFLIVLSTNN